MLGKGKKNWIDKSENKNAYEMALNILLVTMNGAEEVTTLIANLIVKMATIITIDTSTTITTTTTIGKDQLQLGLLVLLLALLVMTIMMMGLLKWI